MDLGALSLPREILVPAGVETLIPLVDACVQALANSPDEVFLRNIKINASRTDVPWLTVVPEHDGHAVLVGGGSSIELPSELQDIADRKNKWGQTIFALNGAAKYLSDKFFEVDTQIIIDPRPEGQAT